MKIYKPFKFIFGIIFLIIGILFLLSNFNLIPNLLFINSISGFWAIGLIIAGVLIIAKQKTLGLIILTISIILGCLILCIPNEYNDEIITQEKFINIENNNEILNYDINFGAGKLQIKSFENNEKLIEGKITSSINQKLIIEKDESEIEVYQKLENDLEIISDIFNKEAENNLNLNINKNSNIKEFNLNFGAAESIIDLRNLNIEFLNLDFGASDVTIYFEENIKTSINCGASDIELYFPLDKNIVIDSQGGLIDVDFKGFKKINDKYYNNYESGKEDIHIKIEAGVSSISGRYYDEIKN